MTSIILTGFYINHVFSFRIASVAGPGIQFFKLQMFSAFDTLAILGSSFSREIIISLLYSNISVKLLIKLSMEEKKTVKVKNELLSFLNF